MKSRKVRRIFARKVKKHDAMISQIMARKAAKEHRKELPPQRDPCKGMATVPNTASLAEIFAESFAAQDTYAAWFKEFGHRMCHIQGDKFRHRENTAFCRV